MALRDFPHNPLCLAIGMALTAPAADAAYPMNFELSDLNGGNGFVVQGDSAGNSTGLSVAPAGDFNADGVPDIIIGAPNRTSGAAFAGAAYIVFGNASGFNHPFDLANIDASSGMVLFGANIFDSVGTAVAAAGDVNGDGFDDVVIGASTASYGGDYAGSTYVLFGSNQPLPASLDVSAVNGSNGIAIHGAIVNGESGTSVAGPGDVNGDGIDDLIIGAPQAGNGTSYVVFGGTEIASNHPISLSGLGDLGFTINAAGTADSAGISVAGAGDFNGDGFDDFVVGATLAGTVGDYAGAAYVVFGTDEGFVSPVNLSLLDVDHGITINGVNHFDSAGHSVAPAGDINGDGIDDVVIGAPKADPNGDASGAAYVVFGKKSPVSQSIELADLDGGDGFALNGVAAADNAGNSVGPAGDLDANGTMDLVVGANLSAPHGNESGTAYLVYGKNSGQVWPASIELSALDGSNGFALNGVAEGDRAATSVKACGDINGDTYTDMIVGAPGSDLGGDNSGAVYVIYGGNVGTSDIIFSDGFEE